MAERLFARRVEHFLPLFPSVRKWKDRHVQVELPLFPGYLFVRIALCDRLQVLQLPSVARLVGFNGTPAAVPVQEIAALKAALKQGLHAMPHPYLTVGLRVRLIAGPLAGVTGILLGHKHQSRVAISIDLIQRSMVVEVEKADLEPAGP